MAEKKISVAQLERDLIWLWNDPPNGAQLDLWAKSVAKDAYTTIRRLRRELAAARKAARP